LCSRTCLEGLGVGGGGGGGGGGGTFSRLFAGYSYVEGTILACLQSAQVSRMGEQVSTGQQVRKRDNVSRLYGEQFNW